MISGSKYIDNDLYRTYQSKQHYIHKRQYRLCSCSNGIQQSLNLLNHLSTYELNTKMLFITYVAMLQAQVERTLKWQSFVLYGRIWVYVWVGFIDVAFHPYEIDWIYGMLCSLALVPLPSPPSLFLSFKNVIISYETPYSLRYAAAISIFLSLFHLFWWIFHRSEYEWYEQFWYHNHMQMHQPHTQHHQQDLIKMFASKEIQKAQPLKRMSRNVIAAVS